VNARLEAILDTRLGKITSSQLDFESRLSTLEGQLSALELSVLEYRNDHSTLGVHVEELAAYGNKKWEKCQEGFKNVGDHLTDLFALSKKTGEEIEELKNSSRRLRVEEEEYDGDADEQPRKKTNRTKKRKERENDLNVSIQFVEKLVLTLAFKRLVRRCFYKAMAIAEGTQGGALLALKHVRGGGWAPDPDVPGSEVLRPDFNCGFESNQRWHTKMVEFVREHGSELEPSYPQEELQGVAKRTILTRLGTVFKHFATKYRKAGVPKDQDGDDGETKVPEVVKARRNQRKHRVISFCSPRGA
jgi:hypothetical protein